MSSIFPPFPQNLIGKRPALSVNTSSGTLRENGQTSLASDQDNAQQYLDALNADIGSLIGIVGGAAIPPSPVDGTVTQDGTVIVGAYQTNSDLKGDRRSVKMFGAVNDGLFITDSIISVSSHILHSASAKFTPKSVGKHITVDGAGVAGAILKTTISAYTSSTQVTLAAPASTTITSGVSWWGTDNAPAINAAIVWLHNQSNGGGGSLFFPFGIYLVSSSIVLYPSISLVGEFGGTRYSIDLPNAPLLRVVIKTAGNFPANGIIIDGRGINDPSLYFIDVLGDGTSVQTQSDATTTGLALGNANQSDVTVTGNHNTLQLCSFALNKRNVWAKLTGGFAWSYNNFGCAWYISVDFEKYAGNDSTFTGNNVNSNNWLLAGVSDPFTDIYTGCGLRLGLGCTAQTWIGGKFEYNGTAIVADQGSWGCHFTGIHFDANSKWHYRQIGNVVFDDIQTIDHRFENCRFNGGSYCDTSNGFSFGLSGLDAHVLIEAPKLDFLSAKVSVNFTGCSFKSEFYNGSGGLYELDPNYPKWPTNNVVATRISATVGSGAGKPILELSFESNDCRYGAVKSGTASVSGTTITKVTGDTFITAWQGRTFWFNLFLPVAIVTVTGPTTLTASASLGVIAASPFYVENNNILIDASFSDEGYLWVNNNPGILPSYFKQSSVNTQDIQVIQDNAGNAIYTLNKSALTMSGIINGNEIVLLRDVAGVVYIGRYQPPVGMNYTGAILDFNSPDATNQPTLGSIRFKGNEQIQLNSTGIEAISAVGIGTPADGSGFGVLKIAGIGGIASDANGVFYIGRYSSGTPIAILDFADAAAVHQPGAGSLRFLGNEQLQFNASGVLGVRPINAVFLGLGTYSPASTEFLRNTGISRFEDKVVLPALTASTPLQLDGTHSIITKKIDLGDSTQIAVTGLASGNVAASDGTKLVGIAGLASAAIQTINAFSTFNLQYKDWAGANQSITVISSLTTDTHTVDRGVIVT